MFTTHSVAMTMNFFFNGSGSLPLAKLVCHQTSYLKKYPLTSHPFCFSIPLHNKMAGKSWLILFSLLGVPYPPLLLPFCWVANQLHFAKSMVHPGWHLNQSPSSSGCDFYSCLFSFAWCPLYHLLCWTLLSQCSQIPRCQVGTPSLLQAYELPGNLIWL